MGHLFIKIYNCSYVSNVDGMVGSEENVCDLPAATGPCRAMFPRWFYNTNSRQCETFNYGGCRGNGNNFATKRDCELRCGRKDFLLITKKTIGSVST